MAYTVKNTGDRESHMSTLLGTGLDETYRFARDSVMGVSLLDPAARQRYFVAAVPEEDQELCLCTDTAGANLGVGTLDPGEEIRLYAAYIVPPETRAVTFELGPKAKLPDLAIER